MAKAYDKNTNIDLTLDLFKNYLSRKGGEGLIKEVTKSNINVKECSKKTKKKMMPLTQKCYIRFK